MDVSTSIEQIEFIHCLMQELEAQDVDLPMGDYNLIYSYIEAARELLAEYENVKEIQ